LFNTGLILLRTVEIKFFYSSAISSDKRYVWNFIIIPKTLKDTGVLKLKMDRNKNFEERKDDERKDVERKDVKEGNKEEEEEKEKYETDQDVKEEEEKEEDSKRILKETKVPGVYVMMGYKKSHPHPCVCHENVGRSIRKVNAWLYSIEEFIGCRCSKKFTNKGPYNHDADCFAPWLKYF